MVYEWPHTVCSIVCSTLIEHDIDSITKSKQVQHVARPKGQLEKSTNLSTTQSVCAPQCSLKVIRTQFSEERESG